MHNYQYYGTKVNAKELRAFIHHFFQTKLTRMLHITLEFDLKTWVQWAEQSELITSEQICNAQDFEKEVFLPFQKMVVKQPIRVDIIAALCTRLANYLLQDAQSQNTTQHNNLKAFLKIDFIPNDIRFTLLKDLTTGGQASLKGLLADVELEKLLLKQM